jgi:hypothetical protein
MENEQFKNKVVPGTEFNKGLIKQEWKTATINPIFKNGARNCCDNY